MKRFWMGSGQLVGVSVLLELAFEPGSHAGGFWHGVPGFDFLLGAGSCALIVVVSKWLGGMLLQRPEDHWDRSGE